VQLTGLSFHRPHAGRSRTIEQIRTGFDR
jgi:hypothetical protein